MKKVSSLLIAAVVILLLTASSFASDNILLVAKDQEAVGFDPHKVPALSSIQIYQHLFNSLIAMNGQMELEPELAESWTVVNDTTYEFKLRKGVKFHNGREMTAADVKYSFERILNPATASIAKSYFDKIQAIETPDPYTVRFILSEPFADFLTNLTSSWASIVPKEVVEAEGDLMKNPVGTGPFKLEKWLPDNYTLLVKNEDYFKPGEPKVDGIKYLIMKDDAGRIAALRTGKVHVSSIGAEVLPLVEKVKGLKVIGYPSLNYTYMAFNTRKAPFNNPKVRLALSYAIDRKQIGEIVFAGKCEITGPISPAAPKWALPIDKFPSYKQDIAKAKKMLAEAGYPNGFSTKIKTANSYQYMINTAVALQNQLKAVGVNAEIELVEWGQYVQDWKEGNNEIMVGLNGSGTTADRALRFFFHTKGTANVWGYSNPEYDELVTKATVTVDENKRWELYAKAQDILVNQDAPNLFLNSPHQFYVVNEVVEGFQPNAIEGESVFTQVSLKK